MLTYEQLAQMNTQGLEESDLIFTAAVVMAAGQMGIGTLGLREICAYLVRVLDSRRTEPVSVSASSRATH